MKKILGISLLSVLFLGLAFCVTDCSCGSSHRFPSTVTGRRYVAPWTETRVSTDSDGNVSVRTIHHPEEFYLHCTELPSDGEDVQRVYEIMVNGTEYGLPDGEPVTVAVRVGRWTKFRWLPSIE